MELLPTGHKERGEGRGGSGGLLWRRGATAELRVRADEEHPDGGHLVRLAEEALAAPQLGLQREQPVPDRPRRIAGKDTFESRVSTNPDTAKQLSRGRDGF